MKLSLKTQQCLKQLPNWPSSSRPTSSGSYSDVYYFLTWTRMVNYCPGFSDAAAVNLYNKAISPLELKFDGEADNLADYLASVKDHCNHFNWSNLITIPLADTTTRNLLTHYGHVTLSNCTDHGSSYLHPDKRCTKQ